MHDADIASEKAQLTEACLDSNVLVQANVPGAQVRGANRRRASEVPAGLLQLACSTTWYRRCLAAAGARGPLLPPGADW